MPASSSTSSATVEEVKDVVEPPPKINKWDASAVKNAMDDAIRDILIKKLGLEEHFALVDGRLAICSVAVGIAMLALLWDYLHPFPQSKPVLMLCVSTYFVMMGILTVYTAYMEKGIFAVAVQKDADPLKWEASSYMKRFDDMYTLSLTCYKGNGQEKTCQWEKSVANYFDTEGNLIMELLEADVLKLQHNVLSGKKEK